MARCSRYNIMWLEAGMRFSPGTPATSTNKTDRHDIAEILLKVEASKPKGLDGITKIDYGYLFPMEICGLSFNK